MTPKQWVSQGRDWKSMLHPLDKQQIIEQCQRQKMKSATLEQIYRIYARKDQVIWLRDCKKISWHKDQMMMEGILCNASDFFKLKQENQILSERDAIQSREVADLQHALKTVISSVGEEKEKLRENISLHIQNNILPIITGLRKKFPTSESILSKLEFQMGNVLGMGHRKLFLIHNQLSPKEIEICYSIVQGLKGKDIAGQLDISYLTLRTHTKNIRRKLGMKREQNLRNFLEEFLYEN